MARGRKRKVKSSGGGLSGKSLLDAKQELDKNLIVMGKARLPSFEIDHHQKMFGHDKSMNNA